MNTIALRFNAPLPFPTAEDIAAGHEAEEKRAQARKDAKLARAKEWLGTRGMAHPAYQFIDRHSPQLAKWWPNRTLRQVEDAAHAAGRI